MYTEWYEKNSPKMTGQGLWLRGSEINTLAPELFAESELRVLFTRLSTYFDTGYSFTHQLLYQIARGTEGVYPDLAYLPPRGDLPFFERGSIPWLLGTQTKRGPRDFDLIGFSNSIVQELINLPHFLRQSGLPLKKSERLSDPSVPLLLMGGANSLYTGLLWESDPLVDGIFVGESDTALRKILETCREGKRLGKPKAEILSDLEAIAGFFQPDRLRSTRKAFIWSLDRSEALRAGPVYSISDQLGKSHLQISEGCPCFCSFCAESWDRKPYRERGSESLKEAALRMKAEMGLDTIELYSFNFNMHSGFYQILWDLAPSFRRIGLKSQRFDLLAQDPQMIEFQHAIEKASVTCGLEGISPRMRRYLHKNLENDQLHRSLQAIFSSKARELKIFLIATGLEEEQDFDALEDLVAHLSEIRERVGARTRVVLSMTPLVRFPWTPLEFEDAHPTERYAKIIQETARRVRQAGLEFRESADLPEYWVSQIFVRAADPRVTQAFHRATEESGFLYYREITPQFRDLFERKLRECGLDPSDLLRGYSLEESYRKPWAKIETGVKRDFLWEEVKRARSYTEIDYCLGRSWAKAKCFLCGGCPSREHILAIVKSKQTRSYSLEQFKARLEEGRKAERSVPFAVEIQRLGRGVPREMVGVALARALMLSFPSLTESYRGFSGSYWTKEDKPCWLTGADVLTLFFHERALEQLSEICLDPDMKRRVNENWQGWGTLHRIAREPWEAPSISISGELRFRPEAYLKSAGLKYIFRKPTPAEHLYDLPPASQKKGWLRHLSFDANASRVRVSPGPKFDFADFLRRAFDSEGPSDWAQWQSVACGSAENGLPVSG